MFLPADPSLAITLGKGGGDLAAGLSWFLSLPVQAACFGTKNPSSFDFRLCRTFVPVFSLSATTVTQSQKP